MTEKLISAFITLFVVIDPAGLGPIFIGLTKGLPAAVKHKIGWEAGVIAFFVLAGSALFGDSLLEKLGISLSAFRIAGGLLLFAIAFEMVFERRAERKADQSGASGGHSPDGRSRRDHRHGAAGRTDEWRLARPHSFDGHPGDHLGILRAAVPAVLAA